MPKNAQVDYSVFGHGFPVITLKNLFILPGVPKLLQQTFAAIRETLFETHAQMKTKVLECFIKSNEFAITDQLNALVHKMILRHLHRDRTFHQFGACTDGTTNATIPKDVKPEEVTARASFFTQIVKLIHLQI